MTNPTFTMLIGIPGSGKSTYAKGHLSEHTVYLSSDSIRKEIFGDEAIQGDPQKVFALMESRTLTALRNGFNVVYDATNLVRKFRKAILDKLPAYVNKKCVVVWASIDDCVKGVANRSRLVDFGVISRMVKSFQPPHYSEGFTDIEVYIRPEFDAYTYEKEVINAMNINQDNPHHTLTVFEHCKKCAELIPEDKKYDMIRNAAFFHDVGKPFTKSFTDSKGNTCEIAHYYNHQNVGAWMSYGIFRSPHIAWLIGYHMEPFFKSKYYNALPDYLKEEIDLIHNADINAK